MSFIERYEQKLKAESKALEAEYDALRKRSGGAMEAWQIRAAQAAVEYGLVRLQHSKRLIEAVVVAR
jgi:hypothetical protein